MEAERIIKNTQEQATASWINYFNQLRLDGLMESLFNQDINLEKALTELEELKNFIAYPEHILGRIETKFGEIAEHVQVNISNARNIIQGLKPEYTFEGVGRTAPEDYLFNGQMVQSKFNHGIQNTLQALKGHLEKYPDFLSNGGMYHIPKDRYDEIMEILSKKPSEMKRKQYTSYKSIRELEDKYNLKFGKDITPSISDYSDVQLGKIDDTITKEEENIKNMDQQQRDAAYEASKPSFKEGAKATIASAAIEGGVALCIAIVKKLRSGKKLNEFTAKDWKEVGLDFSLNTVKGGVRGGTIYTLTNFTATPAPVASSMVTAVFGILEQTNEFRMGNISSDDFLINSQVICLDATISAIASLVGQTIIPIPVIGAVIGNVVGTYMYDIAKKYCNEREQKIISKYNDDIANLNKHLDEQYNELIKKLQFELKRFQSIIDFAFDTDVNIKFYGSIELAEYVGVESEKILRNECDINNYFSM